MTSTHRPSRCAQPLLRWAGAVAAAGALLFTAGCKSGNCGDNQIVCGNGCIPADAVCCDDGSSTSSSYCTNSAGGGCFPNTDGNCSAAFPAGATANYCCSQNGSFGSNDCPAGQHHCGLLCYPTDSECGTVAADGGGGGGGGQCVELQGYCPSGSQCCGGAACLQESCCSPAGGACTENYDCCFGKCTNGACECGSPSTGDGCFQDSDCCAVSPDHVACLDGGASQGYGSCGFTGKLTLDSATCTKVGTSGINLTDFCVTLTGSFEGPVGAGEFFYTDPSTTINEACGPPSGCPNWTANGGCTRGPNDPATTPFAHSYKFSSQSTSGDVTPQLNLDSPNGGLGSVSPTVHCQ